MRRELQCLVLCHFMVADMRYDLKMFSWDVLLNLHNDWKLLTKYKITLPTVVYFVSR
jgi:hypothetical protein